ncbi:hypothetical protein J7382_12770 [Shimia sp. R11_0]|uniref:DUF304 domain-containing protein n=1 Tax=Shimia marina TaxID=321267 RepID=A0A0N7LSP9_9RHOB|nr:MULTISPECIES: hypothetical protein [Shimia]MBO9478412.1 hypothetical protein [Shimia sp. R11_0]CUH54228.1 hypothetical protein SHM7688_03698 [Shimia marina]SFD98096.1 hypothetical protein SAMN04488037_104108 [Shimia marina]
MADLLTPTADLHEDETVLESFQGNRSSYIRTNAWIAAGAMAAGMGILWAIGNPFVWTGAVGGLAAVLVRGAYLMSDELAVRWDLTNLRLLGPGGRAIPLEDMDQLNKLGSFVQVITKSGDKHLIKYQADPQATMAAIKRQHGGPL